ncbi:hypothetical protein CG740_18185 [Streptomyces sp. CB01201]|nr:hypothetical protein CG740_18185 [Streptomyces sp. CB01201]
MPFRPGALDAARRIPGSDTGFLPYGPRVAVRRVRRQDHDELTALAEESTEMLNRCPGAWRDHERRVVTARHPA